MKVLDDSNPGAAPRPSMFLHGMTGNGKSTWACTGGRPLVVLTEPKAQSVLRLLNAQALGLVPESLDDLDQLMVFLGQPDKLAAKGIDRIVLDSFTELTLALPRWLKEKANGPVGTLVKLELSEFGNLKDYALAVVKAIQLTGYPSVIIGRSVSKRVGLVESIRPDGQGKSVEDLPGKLLPTAEARYDAELGYVIDTTPAEHSQRCGLPWVPPVFSGSCLDYLRIIEAGYPGPGSNPAPASEPAPALTHAGSNPPTASTPAREAVKAEAPEPKRTPARAAKPTPASPAPPAAPAGPAAPAPGADDTAWVGLMVKLAAVTVGRPEKERADQVAAWGRAYQANPEKAKTDLEEFTEASARLQAMGTAPDPEADPEGYRKAFSDVLTILQAERKAKGASEPKPETPAAQFANAVAAGPGAAKVEDLSAFLDLCAELKVDLDALWAYALEKGGAQASKDGSKNWFTVSADFLKRVEPQFRDKQKRVGVISWLHQKYSKVPF